MNDPVATDAGQAEAESLEQVVERDQGEHHAHRHDRPGTA